MHTAGARRARCHQRACTHRMFGSTDSLDPHRPNAVLTRRITPLRSPLPNAADFVHASGRSKDVRSHAHHMSSPGAFQYARVDEKVGCIGCGDGCVLPRPIRWATSLGFIHLGMQEKSLPCIIFKRVDSPLTTPLYHLRPPSCGMREVSPMYRLQTCRLPSNYSPIPSQTSFLV
jgi:hypothetical protein